MKRLAALLLLLPLAANADLIKITATNDTDIEPGRFSDFNIVFDDINGDALLQFGEIVSFSGISELTGAMRSWADLLGIPDITGISTASGYQSGEPAYWWVPVEGGGTGGWLAARWNYTSASASVPEPGTLALFGIGLLGIGVARRRRRV